MSDPEGGFIWCELLTSDVPSAVSFYGSVLGWSAEEADLPDRDYTIASAGEAPVGGMMEARSGMRPHWLAYVGVDDVDVASLRVRERGGAIHRVAEDIAGVGRFAVVADPQGAVFALFRPLEREAPAPKVAGATGHVGWHELRATDWKPAFAFYADLFGWSKREAVDMGAMGTYQTFATGALPDDAAVGGMMSGAGLAAPAWLLYFNVDAVGAALARIRSAGGQVVNGPHQVPGGSWIAQCTDPQGANFAVVGRRLRD